MAVSKRKIIIILLVSVLALVTAFILLSRLRPARLNKPESIAWNDSTRTFMVSNLGSKQILSMNDKGRFTIFAKGLEAPRGITVLNGQLWVADGTQVTALDLKSGAHKASIPIKDAKMLNDIASDRQGKLYITDTEANLIHILDPSSRLTESLKSPLLDKPNGIVLDAPRPQMYIVSLTDAKPILILDLNTREFRPFIPKGPNTFDKLDGIAIDDRGRIYYSSWGQQCIIRIPPEQNRSELWQQDLPSPADIYYHQPSNEILVPLMEKNQIRRFKAE